VCCHDVAAVIARNGDGWSCRHYYHSMKHQTMSEPMQEAHYDDSDSYHRVCRNRISRILYISGRLLCPEFDG
jgi:hypothetical protein